MKEELQFKTFTEFYARADELLRKFAKAVESNNITLNEYRTYIYEEHYFSDNYERDQLAKDKCWMWLLSYEYEPMAKNDLYSVLGQLKKGM